MRLVRRDVQAFSEYLPVSNVKSTILLFGHCISTWYAMSMPLVKLMEVGTSIGRG